MGCVASHPAVGVSARASSQEDSQSRQRCVEEWASNIDADVQKEIRLHMAVGTVNHLGALVAEQRRRETQLAELQRSLRNTSELSVLTATRLEHQISQMQKSEAKAAKRLEEASSHQLHTRRETSRLISSQLSEDRDRYASALDAVEQHEPGKLAEFCALFETLANAGEVSVGAEGQVIRDGRFRRAKVVRCLGEGQYEVSIWTQVQVVGYPYEEGFDTSAPVLQTVARAALYLKSRKERQQLSPECTLACQRRLELESAQDLDDGSIDSAGDRGSAKLRRSRKLSSDGENIRAARRGMTTPDVGFEPTSPEFLMLLYADAERMVREMERLGERIRRKVPGVRPIIGPLKGEARAISKALDKYNVDCSRITDLARMTFECQTVEQLIRVLRALSRLRPEWELIPITNRLSPAYDADAFGGYRDMKLNMRHTQIRHIAEVQLTLVPILRVKSSGGHGVYKLAREIKLFDQHVWSYKGALSHTVIHAVRSGVIHELECSGAAGLSTHFDDFLAAIASQQCATRSQSPAREILSSLPRDLSAPRAVLAAACSRLSSSTIAIGHAIGRSASCSAH